MQFKRLLATVMCAGAALAAAPVLAQNVTKIVVPFNAGGATDSYVRLVAAEMSKLGVQTIVENKPGGSGLIAAGYVARSAPDGLTLFMGSNSTMANNVVLFQKMPYDPFKDFAPVSHIGYQPSLLIARANAPFSSLKEMVAYAKANPDRINRASVGAGNITNLAGVIVDRTAGIRTTHVPYTGDTVAVQGLLSDQVDTYVGSLTLALPLHQAGKLRVLGVFDHKRLEQLPDVPTFKESGWDIEVNAWYCLVAPAATPPETITRLNRLVNQILESKEFAERAKALGVERRGGSPQDLGRFIRAEYDRWAPILTELGLAKSL